MASPQRTEPRQRMTVAEFLAHTDEVPAWEYLDGEVVRKPVARDRHAILESELALELGLYRRAHGGSVRNEQHVEFPAPHGCYFRVPDVAYWAPSKPPGAAIALPPTLAIEIRSPSQTHDEQREKCAFMHGNGVDACWLIDPETRTASVLEGGAWRALGAADALTSVHLPGFELPAARLWALLDEAAQA